MQASKRVKARDTSRKEAGRFLSNGRIIISRGKQKKPAPLPLHPPRTSPETEPEAPSWIAGFWSPKFWTRLIYLRRTSVVITWNIIRIVGPWSSSVWNSKNTYDLWNEEICLAAVCLMDMFAKLSKSRP